ncbi:hypothetical protein [Psychrobium sp. 1_MG-2023]|uniref:PKD domain-containing protein n=1 Tax=Psychrobium sp. 1_MG-2023 TaxID=3062624 RepID=UPI000C331244|nr:hypothetical protein [Psychrobium sp. 1_MG-2023]MDP2559538.1 hypothetical protein [Psychrobium sp. 1_MG-2023]PKF59377.1 hypothetical protein CW748_00970 [Alteromonadales bacterium alter-6D02]
MKKNKIVRSFLSAGMILNAAVLVGCGGGGGDTPAPVAGNKSPTLSITGENSIQEQQQLSLTAVAADSDGSVASYQWAVKSGLPLQLSGANSSSVSFTAPDVTEDTMTVLAVTVTDNDGATTTKEIQVTIKRKISSVTITGLVTDNVIANATLEITIGDQTLTAQANGEGRYTAVLNVDDSLINSLINIRAFGDPTINPGVEFASILPPVTTLEAIAGDDGIVDSDENFRVNITNVSTAEVILIDRANGGEEITTEEQLNTLLADVDSAEQLELAAVIKIIVDNDDFDLPEGVDSTFDLITDEQATEDYIEEINETDPDLITEIETEIREDKTLVTDTEGFADAFDASAVFILDEANYSDDQPYSYQEIVVDAATNTTLFKFYEHDIATKSFKEKAVESNDYLLTSAGWVPYAEDHQLTQRNADGSVIFVNSQGQETLVTGELIESAGKNISQLLREYGDDDYWDDSWADNINQQVAFTETASLFKVNFTTLKASYNLWTDGCDLTDTKCDNYTYLENHTTNRLTSLDHLFVNKPWNGVDRNQLKLIHVEGDYHYNNSLKAEFIASKTDSGLVNLYVEAGGNPIRLLAISGSWTREVVHGEELILLHIPEEVLDIIHFDIDADDTRRMFALVNGAVRNGSYERPGDVESGDDVWMNQQAFNQVISHFSYLDTDSDGEYDVTDSDDDNDGYSDSADAFPRNQAEWLDTDGDGVGNNADTDDDGDGVLDNADLDPLDSEVGVAQPLTQAELLASAYINIDHFSVIEPSIGLGYHNAGGFLLNPDGTAVVHSPWELQVDVNWALADDVLTLTPIETIPNAASYDTERLLELGVITPQQAQAYAESGLSEYIQVEEQTITTTLNKIGDNKFVETKHRTITFTDVDQALVLFGNSSEVTQTFTDITTVDYQPINQLNVIPFTTEQVLGQWVLPEHITDYQRLLADIVSFTDDGLAQSEVTKEKFSWTIGTEGQLILTSLTAQAAGTTKIISYVQTAALDGDLDGVELLTHLTTAENTIIGYGAALRVQQDIPEFDAEGEFLLNHFTIANSDYYNEQGFINYDDLWGYVLHSDGSASRGSANEFDSEEYSTASYIHSWQWSEASTGRITINVNRAQFGDSYSNCFTANDDCNPFRRRFWQPVAQIGEETFVLEWSERNINADIFPSGEPDWQMFIPARLTSYQPYDIHYDVDGDGIPNSIDIDDDNDGINDADDLFPKDNYEWADNDGDDIGNNQDQDDDNDGVVDWEDEYPFDSNESVDTDLDGLGNNADTDDDNDGVLDGVDLAPLDNEVGIALGFTVADLADKYISISGGHLDEPKVNMAYISGSSFTFVNDGSGSEGNRNGASDFDWALENNVLEKTSTAPVESIKYQTVSQLVETGLITQDMANNYINMYGDKWIAVSVTRLSEQWQLLENGTEQDSFWVVPTDTYRITHNGDREELTGDMDAPAITVEGDGFSRTLKDSSQLAVYDFEASELTGEWVMPVNYNPDVPELSASTVSFNGDGISGVNLSNSMAFNWSLDAGVLVIDYTDLGAQLRVTRFEKNVDSSELYVEVKQGEKTFSTYMLAVQRDDSANVASLKGNFLLSGITLTNENVYDEDGTIIPDEYFGFRLDTDTQASRIHSANLDIFGEQQWDRWAWQSTGNSLVFTSMQSDDGVQYSDCLPEMGQCNPYRRRHWELLKQVDGRVYVLEWEQENGNSWDFGSTDESWWTRIAPRINFYQVHELDTDADGIVDSADTDIDNDGVLNSEDVQPFDTHVSSDMDGDGVADHLDRFPSDDTEWFDSDNDGLGNNADSDDDNDGIADDVDSSPYRWNELMVSNLTFSDAAVESCVTAALGASTSVASVTYLNCQGVTINSLSDFVQFPNLANLDLSHSDVADWSALGSLTSLEDLDVTDTNLADASQIGLLSGLIKLQVSQNSSITDWSFVSSLSSLEQFAAENTTFNDLSLFSTVSLRKLYLSQYDSPSRVTMSNWSKISDFGELTSLTVANTDFSDLSLITSSVLSYLFVDKTTITDWSQLDSYTSLSTLGLSDTSFTDLSMLPTLTAYDFLGLNAVTVTNWSELGNIAMAANATLMLSGSNITELSTLSGAGFVSLNSLFISNTAVTDIAPLMDLTELLQVELVGVSLTDPTQIDQLRANGVNVLE